jgi:hypothetical protein
MTAPPQSVDRARADRALDRLAEDCEVVAQMTARIESRRPIVRARLEQKLGPELTRKLLAELTAAA